MDFESAAARLQSDHAILKQRSNARRSHRSLASSAATTKAQKIKDQRRIRLKEKRRRDLELKLRLESISSYKTEVERKIGLIPAMSLSLRSTSIHGLGDKITYVYIFFPETLFNFILKLCLFSFLPHPRCA